MKLYVAPPSPRAFKVIALANYLGLEYELKPLDLAKGDQMRPEFAALNPNKKMPVLEDDGFVLWESNAITQYLASKKPGAGLVPEDPRRRAEVNRWQFWEIANWDPPCAALVWEQGVKKLFGMGEADQAEVQKAETNFRRFGEVLNSALKGRRFVTGNDLTVADFSIGAWLNMSEFGQYPMTGFGEIGRWYATLTELAGWKKSIVALPR
ncbi:MAG TPA: glutathione S-transferase family protein [Candidatus Binataceae bacterium]|jgi:glutathione S-transferase|nr:glutathione S-transferase family protein [Candidatus Binataceae bacterium]